MGSARLILAVGALVSLAGAAGAAPPPEIAARYLAEQGADEGGALTAARERRLVGGAGVRFAQRWKGLDVIGGGAYVRLDDAGAVRWASGAARRVPELGAPGLSAQAVLVLLGRPDLPVSDHARLAVWAPPGRAPRLVYHVKLPLDLARLETPRLFVDASTGQVLWRDNLVKTAEGNVFANNPTVSALRTATLELADGATQLAGGDFKALSCVDQMTCPLRDGGQRIRWCEILPLASADEQGDFLYTRPGSDTAVDDAFAEVQMYHHASRTVAFFRSLGFDNLATRPMQAIVNLRLPDFSHAVCSGSTSTVALEPLENAAFLPAGSFGEVWPTADAMGFGQGRHIDYAYDGDVIAHELSHAVIATLTSMGSLVVDDVGLDDQMAAMHEGFADYFAAALVGDPAIAEYVGAEVVGIGKPLRDLENEKRCPRDMDGEEHDDSEMFSAALWQIRSGLAEGDRLAFDRAVYTVVDSLDSYESFASVAQRVAAETGVMLGDAARARAAQVLAERGMDGCGGRIEDRDLGEKKPALYLRGDGTSLVPGPMQFRVELEDEKSEITVTADAVSGDSAGTPGIILLVKRDMPIAWDMAGSEYNHDADGVGVVTRLPAGGMTGTLKGTFAAGTYYLQLANGGDGALLGHVRFEVPGGGGGCAVAGLVARRGAGGWLLGALLGLGLTLAARRRRRAAR